MKTYKLHTLAWEGPEKPEFHQLAQKLNIAVADFDPEFGVVLIDPDNQLYCFMINVESLEKLSSDSGVQGPFSNPKIEPLDPR